eukprot:Skav222269  [mRNA]  locus=scaffold2459:109851:118154:- [translate_table: standard]
MAGKKLHIIVDLQGKLTVQSAEWYIQTFMGESDLRDATDININDPNAWCLISCNAKFDSQDVRNHWIPGFSKTQMGDDIFWDATEGECGDIKARICVQKQALQEKQSRLVETRSSLDDMQIACLESEVTGNVLIAMLPVRGGNVAGRAPAVAMVMSVWISQKMPKLATSPVPLDHAVALRVIRLKPVVGNSSYQGDGFSESWQIRPELVIAVLSVEDYDNNPLRCRIRLTEESIDLVVATQKAQEWWPKFMEEAEDGSKNKKAEKYQGLFVPRQGTGRKRRAKAKAAPKAKANAEETGKEKAKRKIRMRLKKRKTSKALEETPANFVRNAKGEAMIKQVMDRCKTLDLKRFPERALFDENDLCRLKLGKCHGRKWETFEKFAFEYFKTEYHKLSARNWSLAVSGRFNRICQALEGVPPERKWWVAFLRDLAEYISLMG